MLVPCADTGLEHTLAGHWDRVQFPVYAETGPASPANHPALKQAKRLIDAGQAEEAITTLRRFLATSPKPELLDDTYLLLGAALYSTKQYGDALKYLRQLQIEFPDSEVTDRGKLMQARVHAAMGNLDLALPILTGLRNLSKDDGTKREALQLSGDFYAQKRTRPVPFRRGSMKWPWEPKTKRKTCGPAFASWPARRPTRKPSSKSGIPFHAAFLAISRPSDSSRPLRRPWRRTPGHPANPAISREFPDPPAGSENLGTPRHTPSQIKIQPVFHRRGPAAFRETRPFASEVLSGIQLAVEANRDRAGSASVGLIVKDFESDYASFLDDFSELLNTDRPLAVIGPLLSKNLPVMAELAERAHIP